MERRDALEESNRNGVHSPFLLLLQPLLLFAVVGGCRSCGCPTAAIAAAVGALSMVVVVVVPFLAVVIADVLLFGSSAAAVASVGVRVCVCIAINPVSWLLQESECIGQDLPHRNLPTVTAQQTILA